jgi:hypothetical protein
MKCSLDFETQRWMDVYSLPKNIHCFRSFKISNYKNLLTRKKSKRLTLVFFPFFVNSPPKNLGFLSFIICSFLFFSHSMTQASKGGVFLIPFFF